MNTFKIRNIFIVLLIILTMSCGNNLVIDHPLTGEKIEISKKDFLDEKEFGNAYFSCEKLGKNWRIPSKEELLEMYKRRKEIGGFSNKIYLSSTKTDSYDAAPHFGVDFNKGKIVKIEWYSKAACRAVRNK